MYINGWVLVYLKYRSKHGKLHQGLDYIPYLQYCINVDCTTVVLKVLECFLCHILKKYFCWLV